ncbi:MAG TPA: hypothetical protein VLC28_09350, partial [Flavitalea sp.]|nr:hypothetical protein [Flavitalea sp.]
MVRRLLVLSAFLLISFVSLAQTSLIAYNSSWKYLDNGIDQGTSWRALNFNDATWKTGNGKFGYGIPDAATVVSYGTNGNKKYITTYFRKAIVINNPAGYSIYTVKMKRDDGTVLYVNGVEVNRNNMPSTAITYSTLASTASDNGTIVQTFTVPASAFLSGTNIISAEVHQSAASSTDLAFDLELTATINPTPPPPSSDVLLTFNSNWKYLDNGTNQGTAWKTTTFNDAS